MMIILDSFGHGNYLTCTKAKYSQAILYKISIDIMDIKVIWHAKKNSM